ncbi:unnamed protein product [Didymodactylos carnosus]|uniref:G-protein coupled receptors family 1 profile domain-containing protein n=1 Tax=Didymodactylos carnosus TaxID=1234261 RepID=A0A814LJE6_9BILA|nr:unnamed protein product [Didymodactylos carnosus]CAF3834241.1 unnamed protein product [Didymodactylos carnosus]
MFILGVIGNIIGIIVFSSRKFRRTTYGRLALASLFINLLCVFRYSILLHSVTRRWISYVVGQTWFNCKLYRFSSCLRILAAWITVFWTYDRFSYITRILQCCLNRGCCKRYKYYGMAGIACIIILLITGPTVHLYESRYVIKYYRQEEQMEFNEMVSIKDNITLFTPDQRYTVDDSVNRTVNPAIFEHLSRQQSYGTNNSQKFLLCTLKPGVSHLWILYLNDVTFSFNYHTLRSIFSEIIPSILVTLFNIGIILRVIEATFQLRTSFSVIGNRSPKSAMMADSKYLSSARRSTQDNINNNSFDKCVAHNRPKTSWMNMVLILHSCLFCFSSLTHTIVHLFTNNALLSNQVSVVILANCSLNFYVYCLSGKTFRSEILRLFDHHFQYYFRMKFLNIFRTKSERTKVSREIRMNLIRQQSTVVQKKNKGAPSQQQQQQHVVLIINTEG